eukprot:XP_011669616.1 PREDICTED: uncharacterized protein LOC105440782 [Strongylocentrotus purpuratus]
MPVSLGEWRVRIGTFIRRRKKEYDYNYFSRKLFNLIKRAKNVQSPEENNSECNTPQSRSQFDGPECDVVKESGSSCDVKSPGPNEVSHSESSCAENSSSPTANETNPLHDTTDVQNPDPRPCTEDTSHSHVPAAVPGEPDRIKLHKEETSNSAPSRIEDQSLGLSPKPSQDTTRNTEQTTPSIKKVTEYHGSPTCPLLGSGITSGEADAIKEDGCQDMANILLLRSGDVERNPGPNDKPGNLTELELYLLADGMDLSDFRKVGLTLGATEAQLSRFEKDKLGNSMQATYQMLYEWRKTVEESEARDILVNKLESIELVQLADSVRRGQVGDHIPSMTEEEIDRVAEDVKRYLAILLCQIQADPLKSELVFEFERIFTNLTLMEENKDVAFESQDQSVAKLVADHLSSKSSKTLKITREMHAHTVSGQIFIMNHREVNRRQHASCRDGNGSTSTTTSTDYRDIEQEFPTLFATGLGKARNFKHRVKVKADHAPVQQKLRRLPLSVKDKVSQELERLEKEGVVEQIDSSEWISPIVVAAKKSGDVRLCVDLCEVNKAIVVNKFPLPDIGELFSELEGSTVFSKMDLASAYHQLELDEESRDLTAFITHDGLYRFKRVCFGLASAPSTFQKMMSIILAGLPGVQCYLDDVIVYGKDKGEHDKHLHEVLAKLQAAGLRLNPKKCQFHLSEFSYLGHCISCNGLSPDDSHVKAILEAPAPTDIGMLRSVLGMINYYAKFVPNYATVVEPLRCLLRKDFDYTVEYKAGRDNVVADALSRVPLSEREEEVNVDEEDEFILNLVEVDGPVMIEELQDATRKDKVLVEVEKFVEKGWPANHRTMSEELKPYFMLREELSIEILEIRLDDFSERPSASRDLAQFFCKMPHLKNMILHCGGGIHDDFYSTSSSMASSAKNRRQHASCRDGNGSTSTTTSTDYRDIEQEFPTLFATGLGKARNFKHRVKVKADHAPVQQKLRRLPLSVKDKVSQELERLEKEGVVEQIDSSEWISPIVVAAKKSGDVRLCVDLCEVNKAIVVNKFPLPDIGELFSELEGSTVFSKMDLASAYHQLELDEESRDLTAFITHDGLYRFKRVCFGLASAPSTFQKMMSIILAGLPGVQCYLDDVIVYGKDKGEHDKHLHEVLAKLQAAGLRLNPKKCQFHLSEFSYLGHCISCNGLSPDDSHVKAILEAPAPTDIGMLRSVLGMINYYAKFVPNYATVVEPLRCLLRKDFDYTVEYKAGRDNVVADALSRVPLSEREEEVNVDEEDEFILNLVEVDGPVMIEELQDATRKDKVLVEVEKFVEKGWPANHRTMSEELKPYFMLREELSTALHCAAQNGHLDVTEYLIGQGAEVNEGIYDGWTALHIAAQVKKGDNDGETALHFAALNGHIDVTKVLIIQGAEVKRGDNRGRTALHIAAQVGHLDFTEYLISQGAEVNRGNNEGKTALHSAVQMGHLEVTKYLISQGAEVNPGDNDTMEPMLEEQIRMAGLPYTLLHRMATLMSPNVYFKIVLM